MLGLGGEWAETRRCVVDGSGEWWKRDGERDGEMDGVRWTVEEGW